MKRTKRQFAIVIGKKPAKRTTKEIPSPYWHEVKGLGERIDKTADVCIRSLTELRTAPEILIKDVYFDGGDVLRCYEGRFRFVLDNRPPIVICAGESIVVYPGQRVTIEALDATNLILYAIYDGNDVAAYFDRFGFFDGMHGKTSTQTEVFHQVMRWLSGDPAADHSGLGALMASALTTYAHDFMENGNALVCEAIRQIRLNLKNRIVRIDPLCDQLKVSRSYLHRAFRNAGLLGASEFIKQEQLRHALHLLKATDKSIADIAEESGFLSVTHFATFVRSRTGKSPRELRR